MNRRPWLPARWGPPLTAIRVVLALTVLLGLGYPLGMTAAAQVPGLRDRAEGSPLTGPDGERLGSELIGQSFTDVDGEPLPGYFQPRPSHAGAGYDASASAAGNLGPESTVDTPPVGNAPGVPSLLTLVCARSRAIGLREGVDGGRPYCTADGVGAVLGVYRTHGTTGRVTRVVSLNQPCPARPFRARYAGVAVGCARPGEDRARAVVTPVRGDAPARPVVPGDAVTASGSGLDPHISPAYARLQTPRVAARRGLTEDAVRTLVTAHTTGRALGVLGEPVVSVAPLNAALDRLRPGKGA
ncbi:potassium-transporting ATPase subunit C [Streptomyces sp. NPDC058171]